MVQASVVIKRKIVSLFDKLLSPQRGSEAMAGGGVHVRPCWATARLAPGATSPSQLHPCELKECEGHTTAGGNPKRGLLGMGLSQGSPGRATSLVTRHGTQHHELSGSCGPRGLLPRGPTRSGGTEVCSAIGLARPKVG